MSFELRAALGILLPFAASLIAGLIAWRIGPRPASGARAGAWGLGLGILAGWLVLTRPPDFPHWQLLLYAALAAMPVGALVGRGDLPAVEAWPLLGGFLAAVGATQVPEYEPEVWESFALDRNGFLIAVPIASTIAGLLYLALSRKIADPWLALAFAANAGAAAYLAAESGSANLAQHTGTVFAAALGCALLSLRLIGPIAAGMVPGFAAAIVGFPFAAHMESASGIPLWAYAIPATGPLLIAVLLLPGLRPGENRWLRISAGLLACLIPAIAIAITGRIYVAPAEW